MNGMNLKNQLISKMGKEYVNSVEQKMKEIQPIVQRVDTNYWIDKGNISLIVEKARLKKHRF